MRLWLSLFLAVITLCAAGSAQAAVRIKDITKVEGARSNQLVGVGLVVGLNRTGGRSLATQQMAIDMLRRMDVTTKIAREGLLDNVFQSTNISMVMVTAELPPFARPGSKMDVSVSVLDDAQSLRGGTLLLTTLKGADGEVYAIAQGPLSLGGVNLESQVPQSALINHATNGRIANGAIVEKEALGTMSKDGRLRFLLEDPDFDTANEIALVINNKFIGAAKTLDMGTIEVRMNAEQNKNVVAFIGECGNLIIKPDTSAKVIINERTGTVIVGQTVKIATVAISHGNLIIRPVDPRMRAQPPLGPAASALLGVTNDPAPAAAGNQPPQANAPTTGNRVNVVEEDESITVSDFARALNALGTSPKELISIFQALKRAGALHAELVIM